MKIQMLNKWMGYKAIYFAIGEKALGFLQIYSIIFQIYNKQNRVFFFFKLFKTMT